MARCSTPTCPSPRYRPSDLCINRPSWRPMAKIDTTIRKSGDWWTIPSIFGGRFCKIKVLQKRSKKVHTSIEPLWDTACFLTSNSYLTYLRLRSNSVRGLEGTRTTQAGAQVLLLASNIKNNLCKDYKSITDEKGLKLRARLRPNDREPIAKSDLSGGEQCCTSSRVVSSRSSCFCSLKSFNDQVQNASHKFV